MLSEIVLNYLEKQGIPVILHEHVPVLTVEAAKAIREGIDGMHCKNLFLVDSKRKQYYLLSAPADKRFSLMEVRKMVSAKRMSLAKPEKLQEILQVELGSASPFGLINDEENQVHFLVDKEIWDAERVTFHPNVNSMTIEVIGKDFRKYVEGLDNTYTVLTIETEVPE